MISQIRDAIVSFLTGLTADANPIFRFVDGRLPKELKKLPAAVVRFAGAVQSEAATAETLVARRDLTFRVHLYFDLVADWSKAEDQFETAVQALLDALLEDDSLGGLAESIAVEIDDSEPVLDLERGALYKVALLRVETEAG